MVAECKYNGVEFLTLYKTRVSSRPVLDEAQRTTVYVEHTLTIDGYLVANQTSMATLRKRLTACGGELIYRDKGFGDLVVNSPGNGPVRDVKWGPIPTILEWIGLGGEGNAAHVVWQVTTRFPECDDATYEFAMLAFNYDATYEIDQDGYTTIQYTGYLEIPLTRGSVNDRRVYDSADRYREAIQRKVPLGFQLENQSYTLSKDRRRLDFRWRYRELPTPRPPRVSSIEAKHTVRSDVSPAFVRWTMTIEATITMARGVPPSESLGVFLRLVSDRTERLLKRNRNRLGAYIPNAFTISESIFGRSTQFSFSASLVRRTKIDDFLFVNKLWWPLAGTNYRIWQTSMQDVKASGHRGYAGAGFSHDHDQIVDLCLRPATTRSSKTLDTDPSRDPSREPTRPPRPGNTDNTEEDLGFNPRRITPRYSWLLYEIWIEMYEDSNIARHKPLPRTPDARTTPVPPSTPTGPGAPTAVAPAPLPKPDKPLEGFIAFDPSISRRVNVDGASDSNAKSVSSAEFSGQGTAPPDVFQSTRSPSRTIILAGYGVRLNYRIPIPALLKIGKVKLVEKHRYVREQKVAEFGDIKIYRADWRIQYELPEAPDTPIPIPSNPFLGTGGASADAPR